MAKLKYYGGCGIEGHYNLMDTGKFEVIIDGEVTFFTKLSDAKEYYDSINNKKSLWDVEVIPELIEGHTY